MSVLRPAWERPEPERDRATGAATHYKVTRRTAQRIASGSLACPSCDLPLFVGRRLSITAPLQCPFCGLRDAARGFVRLSESDVQGNRVALIARLPA